MDGGGAEIPISIHPHTQNTQVNNGFVSVPSTNNYLKTKRNRKSVYSWDNVSDYLMLHNLRISSLELNLRESLCAFIAELF